MHNPVRIVGIVALAWIPPAIDRHAPDLLLVLVVVRLFLTDVKASPLSLTRDKEFLRPKAETFGLRVLTVEAIGRWHEIRGTDILAAIVSVLGAATWFRRVSSLLEAGSV